MKFRANIVFLFGTMLMIITGCAKSSSVHLFNDDWYFKITDEPVHEQNADLESWESVSIPHTPMIEPKVMKGQWQGICWYQKTFEVPLKHKGQRLLMKFDGAMNTCDVWINGIKVAAHMGGYLPVVFDFTHAAVFGKKNKVLVRLNNNDNPVTGPKPMHLLDFNMYGGLYRDVVLIIKNPLHITDPVLAAKPASGGVFVTYPEVSATEAIVQVKTHVANSGKKAKTYSVQNELWYGKQMVASVLSVQGLIKEDEQAEIISKLMVRTPKLWSPRSPSLYTLKTKLLSKGQVVDEVSTRIGIRRIEISKDSFSVNGEKMFLRGVNRHQDYPYIGYALSNEAQYRDAFKIKSAGFDFVRLSHYPHAPAFMDACDELGILVLDAILGWQYNPNSDAFRGHVLQTCRDLIRRDRNHPCVLAWEFSLNESRMDNAFIDKAHLIAHEEYPGDQCFTAGWQRYRYDIFLQARQHRLGKYSDPLKPYIVSEYGDWEYYAQNAGFNQDSWSDLLQSERSSRQLLADGEVRLLQQTTNIQEAHNDNFNTAAFADGYWAMFDYNRGYADDLEASGLMSIDRIPKFSYYFFQSQRPAIEHS